MAGFPTLGISKHSGRWPSPRSIIVFFTYINYRGASETGAVGNVITIAKVIILALFVVFGIHRAAQVDNWSARFTDDFLPNGTGGDADCDGSDVHRV